MQLDFEIDVLTHSIENVATGECFSTLVLPLAETDLTQAGRLAGSSTGKQNSTIRKNRFSNWCLSNRQASYRA
ncbi:MAG: hypothetical protein LBR08_04175 [Bacteroidales bacterium]|nr:hypothetical protein [Bacteroidales bacterium]